MDEFTRSSPLLPKRWRLRSDKHGSFGFNIFEMRRSVRLAARAINEVKSQTIAAEQISAQTSRSNFVKKEDKLPTKTKIKKWKSTKRPREKSTTDPSGNEGKDSELKPSVIIDEKIKPTIKRVKTESHVERPSLQGKFVGAHVSISGGLHNAVSEALEIGAKAFGLFLRSQRQWVSKPLEDKAAERFRNACAEAQFSPHAILPHGIYLMNCGSPEEETLAKSRSTLVDELKRCERLGLLLYNFHPGSTCGKITVDECLDKIAESINQAHKETKFVVTVLENMSCQGNTVSGFCFYLDFLYCYYYFF